MGERGLSERAKGGRDGKGWAMGVVGRGGSKGEGGLLVGVEAQSENVREQVMVQGNKGQTKSGAARGRWTGYKI